MSKTRVGIINVTGYVGIELARLLCRHPGVELVSVTGRSAAGQKLGRVFPHMAGIDLTVEAKLGEVDLAFSAMPHGESAAEVIPLLERGLKVVDMSGDLRLKDAAEWRQRRAEILALFEEHVYGKTPRQPVEVRVERREQFKGCRGVAALVRASPSRSQSA